MNSAHEVPSPAAAVLQRRQSRTTPQKRAQVSKATEDRRTDLENRLALTPVSEYTAVSAAVSKGVYLKGKVLSSCYPLLFNNKK